MTPSRLSRDLASDPGLPADTSLPSCQLDWDHDLNGAWATSPSSACSSISSAAPPSTPASSLGDRPRVLFLQMELLSARTLKDWLSDSLVSPQAREQHVAVIFNQILRALDAIHGSGYVHRDMKPDNVFVAQEQLDGHLEVKVGDFGLSTRAHAHAHAASSDDSQQPTTTTNEMERTAGVGTPLYASPEQASGLPYDSKADMFAVGVMLAEALHGPFATLMERAQLLTGLQDDPSAHGLPPACPWAPVVAALLQRRPSLRPSAAQVLQHPLLTTAAALPCTSSIPTRVQALQDSLEEKDAIIQQLRAQLELTTREYCSAIDYIDHIEKVGVHAHVHAHH